MSSLGGDEGCPAAEVGYILEEGGSRLSWLMAHPWGINSQSASTTLPAPCPAAGGGICSRGLCTSIGFCSRISKCLVKKTKGAQQPPWEL